MARIGRVVVRLPEVKCQKCGNSWVPRVVSPKECPYCGSRKIVKVAS